MARDERIEIELLADECWWGGVARHGDQMPFTARSEYRTELGADLLGNQGCPLLVSSAGRYVWSEEPFSFEFKGGLLTIEEALGRIERGQGNGDLRGAYLAAARKFFPPSGKTPTELSFRAPQYNPWIEMLRHPTQEKVSNYARAILDAGMPPGVLIIDDWWYRSNCTWRWDREAFPHPERMVCGLHEQGFLVVLWISHFVTPDTQNFLDLRDWGYLLHDGEGEPIIEKWWNGYGGIVDLSHPDAFAWFQGELDKLVADYGIDGFKFDGGDPHFFQGNFKSHSPHTPNDFCEDFARIGLKYPLSEYRACWKLGGQHLIQRVRDKHHRWGEKGMVDLIPTALAQGLLGYAYSCPDMVGGGEDTSFTDPSFRFDQELFVRWAQCSAFFPVIQYSILPSRVLDDEHLSLVMAMLELRQRMSGEILELARHAAATGEPMMRHMEYVFGGEGLDGVLDQYMLGDKYLIAPVLAKGAVSRTIRFPSGRWVGDDGSEVTGPCEAEVPAPLSRLPWYTRIG